MIRRNARYNNRWKKKRTKKANKSTGKDDIEAVKIGGYRLLEEIKELFNNFVRLQQRGSPTRWYNALTILLHKKGDLTDPENFRPISLLDHLYKLFKNNNKSIGLLLTQGTGGFWDKLWH